MDSVQRNGGFVMADQDIARMRLMSGKAVNQSTWTDFLKIEITDLVWTSMEILVGCVMTKKLASGKSMFVMENPLLNVLTDLMR